MKVINSLFAPCLSALVISCCDYFLISVKLTLLKFDIVDLDEKIQEELMESIQREGRVLYEKI